MSFQFRCPLLLLSKTCVKIPMQCHRLLQNAHSFLLSSSDSVCILSLLLFLEKYVNILYSLDPHLFACNLFKLELITSLPDA
jgi:hypothetical protein